MAQLRPLPSIVHFTQLLADVARMKDYSTVISLYKQVEELGVKHDIYSLSVLINCFCCLDLVNFGFSVLGRMLKLGYEPDPTIFNSLVNGLVGKGKLSRAMRFFEEMLKKGYQPDLITYNTIVKGLCKEGDTSMALELLKKMEEIGYELDVVAYNTIIDGLCKNRLVEEAMTLFSKMLGLQDEAFQLFRKMEEDGCLPNKRTYSTMIQGYLQSNDLKMATQLIHENFDRRYPTNASTATSVADLSLIAK